MASRQEEYRAIATLEIASQRPGDDSLDGRAVQLPCEKGCLEVTLRSNGNNGTTVELVWTFMDWFNESSGQSHQESTWDLWERSGLLFMPNLEGSVDFNAGLAVGEILLSAATPYLARLALVSRAPYFWSRVRDADLHDLAGEVCVTVAGRVVKLGPVTRRFLPAVRPSNSVDAAGAAEIASSPLPPYGNFLLTADRRFMEGDRPDAVVHLAQGLEIAAYRYVRQFEPDAGSAAQTSFNPSRYFGPTRMQSIQDANPHPVPEYPAICELFGARNEWVHEGRAQVRPFDGALNKASSDRSKCRPLAFEDYYRFRRAVSAALVWMGEPPIE